MTDFEKVFFDTAPFIYLLENNPKYYLPVAEYITDCVTTRQVNFATSVITIAEFGVKPITTGKHALIDNFKNLIDDLNFQLIDINTEIAQQSSVLRANYSFLKGIDALQLAAAIHSKSNEFFTNDKALKPIKEIKITVLEDLVKK